MHCKSCEYGRRAGAEKHVACGYFFTKHQQDYQKIMEELNLDKVTTGWGYMHCPVDGDTNVFGRGIMTNEVVIFREDFACSNYRSRDYE